MHTSATAWWAAKSGNAANEYEDAYAVKPDALRFAVADGASETSFARAWAELLVEGFVEGPPSVAELHDWLTPLQRAWVNASQGQATDGDAQEKARGGAFTSFLGLAAVGEGGGALAVGDSCLFVVRAGRMERAFPLARAEQFNNRPLLLSSVARAN